MLYSISTARFFLLIAFSLIYAIFDVFNKRNVPNKFVYFSIIIGILATLSYYPDLRMLGISFLIASIIGSMGYILYKKGVLGGGDVFEFMLISLIIPLQPRPLLINMPQYALPFVLSVFIVTGYVSFMAIAFYYLLLVKNPEIEKRIKPDRKPALVSSAFLTMYVLLIYVMGMINGFSSSAILLIALVAIPSSIVLAYEKLINARMVSMMLPEKLEEGDMIAVNMMNGDESAYFSKRYSHFGRLATNELISEMKNEKKKLPVYSNAPPLALFTFAGVILALLFGNVLLYFLL